MQDFQVDFVKRSIDILNNYEGEYTFSNLLNCTLGLIISPFEKGNNVEVWAKLIDEIEVLKKVQINNFSPKYKRVDEPKSLMNFLRRIRHAFAHQNIFPINENQKFVKVQITNQTNGVEDLNVIFNESQLKSFALFIANTYLSSNGRTEKPLVLTNSNPKIETVN